MNILYLTHDVTDPATARRVRMLSDGGATVSVAGFRRDATSIDQLDGAPVIDLGRTYNGRFLQRVYAVLRTLITLHRHRTRFAQADIILARNVEMLAIGVRGRRFGNPAPVLVYECLDIHRLLLNDGFVGKTMRTLEGWLTKRASALLTSSPAFIRQYFEPRSQVQLPTRLVENKVYMHAESILSVDHPPATVWRIGWFGALRCAKSLQILSAYARAQQGKVEIILRGRPAYDQIPDFDAITTQTPHLHYGGPYQNPQDLAALYGDVHFSWAIDMFEEGLNSSWLLPNRVYEGGFYGAVPIAASGVETSRFIQSLGIGITLTEPKDRALADVFSTMTAEHYQQLHAAMTALPRDIWVATKQDCVALVAYLGGLPRGSVT